MHWTVAASFIHDTSVDGHWWLPHIPGTRHGFTIIPNKTPLANWHNQLSGVTSYRQWVQYFAQGKVAVEQTQGGVITVFPQLAATVGIYRRFYRRQIPVVACLFNVNRCYPGVRHYLARASLANVTRFVVVTRRECDIYSRWLALPKERFEFIPFPSAEIPVTFEENTTAPFVAAIGSAHRDFATLFSVVQKLNIPTVVASGKRSLAGLEIPSCVKAPLGIGKQECMRLAQEARIIVVPMKTDELVTAAGMATIVESLRMGRAVIASKCNGAEDYIVHGETGLLVQPGSNKALADSIQLLWEDVALRERLGQAAKAYAAKNFSEETCGRALGKTLDQVADFGFC